MIESTYDTVYRNHMATFARAHLHENGMEEIFVFETGGRIVRPVGRLEYDVHMPQRTVRTGSGRDAHLRGCATSGCSRPKHPECYPEATMGRYAHSTVRYDSDHKFTTSSEEELVQEIQGSGSSGQ